MEKDPKQVNPQSESANTYPGQRNAVKAQPEAIDLLPSIFRTDTNKKVLGAVVEDLFQPSAIENVNFQVGRPTSSADIRQEFLPKDSSRRQLECGLLVEDSTGTRVLTADDIALAQGHANDHMAEPAVPVSILDLPIDADKFLNWSNYYWAEDGLPILYVSGPAADSAEETFDVERDIIGKRYFTLPTQINGRKLELKNGMRLVFQKAALGRKTISGDTQETHIADGGRQIDFQHEMTQQYNKANIVVRVDGELRSNITHFRYTRGSLIWNDDSIPPAGAVVEFDMPDFWLTLEKDARDPDFRPDNYPFIDRRWRVEGVGTPSGIRLLPRTHQTTSTVYSSSLPSQWDRVNIPWDRIEWDAELLGINQKHYSLMAIGAENRASHSRVNAWVHKDTIKTVADYLDVDTTTDIIPADRVALRPIIEFDSSLELYNHGTRFRHWVDAVVDKNLTDPTGLRNTDVVYLLVSTALGTIRNFTDATTGITLYERITNAIKNQDDDDLTLAIRGLEPKLVIIDTIAKIKTLVGYLTRGVEKNTFGYSFDTSNFSNTPAAGKIKFDSNSFSVNNTATLAISAIGSDDKQNSSLLEKVYNENFLKCYYRVYDPANTASYILIEINSAPKIFGRTTRSVDLYSAINSTVEQTLTTGTLLELAEDQGSWFRVRLLGSSTDKWIRGGVVKDHYQITGRIIRTTAPTGFANNKSLSIGFVKVEHNPQRIERISQRVLWMADGAYKNTIVTFGTNAPYDIAHDYPTVTGVIAESAQDGDAVVVSSSGGQLSLREFHWVNGQCVAAQTRSAVADVSRFRIYDREGIALDQWFDANGYKPNRSNSTILEFDEGSEVDSESGFKLKFLPSQFRQLDSDSPAANAFYDVQFRHTLQDSTTYFVNSTGEDRTISGPYNFRRLASNVNHDVNLDLADGLSSGYRRAWFRLRSWVSNTYDISALSTDLESNRLLALPADAWPSYHWYLGFNQGLPSVRHTDNFDQTADNIMIGALGEKTLIDSSGVESLKLIDHYSDAVIVETTSDALGHCELSIPNDVPTGFYDLVINDDQVIKFMVLDPKFDPRSPKIAVDGLPVNYEYAIERNVDGEITSLQLKINATNSLLEVQHQGSFTSDSDHATSLPGLEYNPTQDLDLRIVTPSRLARSLKKCIQANSLDGRQPWNETAKIFALDGAVMADTSSQRAQWALNRLEPNLSEAVAARSMAAWRWYRRFVALINRYNDENDLSTQPPRYWLDQILTELTVGMNYSVPDAVSGMALPTSSMNSVEYVANGVGNQFDVYTAGADVYQGIYGPDHIYVYVNEQQWMQNENYEIDDVTYSFQLIDAGKKISFSSALPVNTNVKIFHAAEESVYSGIPASPAKLGLGGVFQPKIVRETWGSYDRLLIQKHDGSRTRTFQIHTYSAPDLRDQIVLELEYRIWAGCVNRVGEQGRQRLMLSSPPGTPISEGRAQAALEWFVNNDVDFRVHADYDVENPWTYNYGGKNWRAIYLEAFGTLTPHTHPWEMLGFDEEPAWWSTHYDWFDTNKRSALESALESGLISQPGTPATHDPRVRRQHPLGFPVNALGELVSPAEWGYTVPEGQGAANPWDLGALGPQEEVWLRSSAGVWARILDTLGDIRLADKFIETGITPFVPVIQRNSPAPVGVLTQAPSSFVQARPTIGIGAVLFETYREINLLGESPILELGLVQSVLQFGMGGFSDATARFRMYHTKYQNSNYVPEEDYSLVINPSVATSRVRFSAVRVELDGNGYRVYGYDHQYRYFEVATPVKSGPNGGQSGTYRRIVTTPNGDFIRYLKWDLTPQRVEYGTRFETKQDLFDFFIGIEEIQKSQGLLFDQLNSRGTIDDWQQAAIDAMSWISENWGSDIFVVVSPISSDQGFRFQHAEGQLERLDAEQLRRGKILFFSGRLAQNKDLFVTRDIEPNIDYVQSLDQQQIVFADLRLRKFDHVYYFNSFTRFGDLLIDKQTNTRIDYLDMVARRSRGWTGRTQAQGMIPANRGLLPGFDAVISDIVESRRPEKSQFDTFKGSLSKSNVVPLKTSVLNEIILDPSVSFQFRQGLQAASGTNLAIDALFRNREFDIPGRTQDLNINEQWLFNDGDFGRLGDRKVWEILVKRSDLTSKRQAFRFSDGAYITGDSRSDAVIDIVGSKDSRWITRDFIDPDFGMIARSDINPALTAEQGWLPSAGVTNLLTSDIEARDADSLLTVGLDNDKMQRLLEIRSFSKFVDYLPGDIVWYQGQIYQCQENIFGGANTAWDSTQWTVYTEEEALNSPPTTWVSDYAQRDADGRVIDYGWNLLQFLNPLYIEEICPNAINTGLNESKVTFGSPHGFKTNDVIFITGSGDGNYDGLHRVVKRVDDYNLLIAARSTGDVVIYNLVAFKIAPTKFRSLAELETALPPTSNLRSGMVAYVEPDGSPEGEYLVYVFEDGAWVNDPVLSTVSKAMVDSHSIEKVLLIDAETEEVLANLEVFDPYKGLIIDEVGQYINYRSSADPAIYNLNDLGLPDLDAVELWGQGQLGQLWWDTSRVRYFEYEQSDLRYRIQNWGKQFADSEVQIFEWSRSTDLPTIDDEPNIRLDYSSGIGVPRYSAIEEEDPVTGALTIYYYFWKRGVDALPANSTRKYSAQDIEYVLQDPDAAGVSWFSPVYGPGSSSDVAQQFNAFVVSNIDSYMSSRNEVILRVVQKNQPEQQHSNALLVSEGFTGDVIPEYLYRRMKSSVVGRDHYRKNYELKTWQPNTVYNKGDYVINWSYSQLVNIERDGEYQPRDIPIILEMDGGRESVKEVLRPVLPLYAEPPYDTSRPADDPVYRERLHQVMVVRTDGYESSNSFLEDFAAEKIVLSAASALVKRGLDINGYRACVIINRRVPDPRLHPLRRYGNAYVPVPQTWYADIREARRNLLKAANAYLLNVNAVSKTGWDSHLREYKPLFGAPLSYDPEIKYLDLTPYWYYVDYVKSTYEVGSEQYFVDSINAIYADERDGVFGIADAQGEIQASYIKADGDVELVYQRDGTIQFVEDIWIDSWDASRWNRYRYDEDNAEVFESIIRALREDIFEGTDQGYFNLLFFDMVKESLRQVPNADWVSKTTYLDIAQSSNNDLKEVGLYFDRRDIQVKEYVNEVKPYHSKIVNVKQNLNTNEEFSLAFGERLVMSIVRNVEVVSRDYFEDLPAGDVDAPDLETQAMFQPTRSGYSVPTGDSENPVTWTQSPILTGGQEMLQIADPEGRVPTVLTVNDPDTLDIDDLA